MSNFEKIKEMTIEELAEFLLDSTPFCDVQYDCKCKYNGDCTQHAIIWLNENTIK